jgi:hypothetical protein
LGQELFAPPAVPTASGVRGIADPAAPSGGPIPRTAVEGSPITPTPAEVPASAQPVEGAQVIARIDGQIVLASDLLWQVDQLIAMSSQPIPPEHREMARMQLTERLLMGVIDTKLLYADFRRTVPAENLPKVEESIAGPFEEIEVPRLMKILKITDRAALDATLRRYGTSLKDVQRQFTEKTIAGEWLRQIVKKPEPISYEALLAYYQDHPKEFEFEATVTWEELMVRFDRCEGDRDRAWRELCEMGNEVWQAAAANPQLRGPVFAAVAKSKSHGTTAADGGIHEDMTVGALRCEAINEALAALAVGQMSDGIESDVGFHIVRVLERTAAGRTPFTEAQAGIRKLLETEQRTALLEAELKRLRSSARVWTIFHGEVNGPRLAAILEENSRRR